MVVVPIAVLMIDDNPADAGVVERLLKASKDFKVRFVHALDASSGMERLNRGDIDCVLLDFHLDGTDGNAILKRVRESGLDVAVITLTGLGSELVAVEALKGGAQDYIVKGQITPDLLRRAIVNAMDKVALERKVRESRQEQASFVATVSHDLRTPLRHIRKFSAFLREDAPALNVACLQHLERIEDAGKRMMELIESLLEYTRTGRSGKHLVQVNTRDVLDDVLEDLSAVIDESGAVVETVNLPVVMGDPVGLRQLFQNLIGNAIKYNTFQKPVIRVVASQRQGEWLIGVRDNGPGIAQNSLEEIFQPMKRLQGSEDQEGLGLGLAIASRIVHQHGGRIWAESAPGQGCTLNVTFPVVPEAVSPSRPRLNGPMADVPSLRSTSSSLRSAAAERR